MQDVETASIETLLELARQHLGMDAAFVSEFTGGRRVFRFVSLAPGAPGPKVGDSHPLEDSYCNLIAADRLARAIPDTESLPVVANLAITKELGIRSYLGAKVVRSDGSLYGAIGAFSRHPDPLLGPRDAAFFSLIAELAAVRIRAHELAAADAATRRMAVQRVLDEDAVSIVVQPIVSARTAALAGAEVLSRVASEPVRTPDWWFREAAAVGLGTELELVPVRAALALVEELEVPYLSVNLSAATLASDEARDLFEAADAPLDRLVVEITEHTEISDSERVLAAVDALRGLGVRFAVDDAGTGYSGLSRILQLAPEFIKLDRALIAGIDSSPAAKALAASLAAFGREIGATVVAEGVETEAELRTLLAVGIDLVQGYLMGRPAPPPPKVAPMAHRLVRPRVLVVDDDPIVRAIVATHLSRAAFDVVAQAGNGLDAIELARRMPLDAVVMDMEMPVLDGLGALPGILAAAPHARIVALTSNPYKGAESIRLGATAYVSKDEGIGVIEQLLRRDR